MIFFTIPNSGEYYPSENPTFRFQFQTFSDTDVLLKSLLVRAQSYKYRHPPWSHLSFSLSMTFEVFLFEKIISSDSTAAGTLCIIQLVL